MFIGICYLRSFKSQVDEVFAQGAAKGAAQDGKVFFRLVFRHHADALLEFGDDLLVIVDVASVDGGDVAPLPANMTAQLADFLIIHG